MQARFCMWPHYPVLELTVGYRSGESKQQLIEL